MSFQPFPRLGHRARRLVTCVCATAALAVSSLPARAQAPERSELSEPVLRIPMDQSTRHIGFLVKINGEGPYRFNLDTGAGYHACIDAALVEELGLKRVDQVRNSDGSGIHVRLADVVGIDTLEFGGARFKGVKALVDDYSWIDGPGGEPIQGLLGFELFRNLLLTVDYPRNMLELRRGSLPKEERENVVRYTRESGIPEIPVRIGKQEIPIAIDTGSTAGLTLPALYLNRLEIHKQKDPVVRGSSRTVYGQYATLRARLVDDTHMAGHALERLQARFTASYESGLLGYEVLRDFSLTFDQKRRRVRILRGDPNPVLAKPVVSVPLLRDRQPVVEVMVEGQGPYRFAIHTGTSGQGIIDRELARRLGLRTVGQTHVSDAGGGNLRTLELVWADRLDIGSASFAHLRLIASNEGLNGEKKLHGVLGMDLFSELLLTLDYPGRTLELSRASLSQDSGSEVVHYSSKRGPPTIDLKVGDGEIPAFVSTGSRQSIVLPSSALRQLKTERELQSRVALDPGQSDLRIRVGKVLDPLSIAGERFEGVEAHFVSGREHATLGHGLLRELVVSIDQRNGLISLRRERSARLEPR